MSDSRSSASAGARVRRERARCGRLGVLAGCAGAPRLEAQWSDPSLAPGLLRGARVLVACDAAELVVRQICQDQLAGEVVARGATPVFVAPGFPLATDRSVDAQLLPAAREAGAKAMLVMTVAVVVNDISPGLSVGIGGFGMGRHGGAGCRHRRADRRRHASARSTAPTAASPTSRAAAWSGPRRPPRRRRATSTRRWASSRRRCSAAPSRPGCSDAAVAGTASVRAPIRRRSRRSRDRRRAARSSRAGGPSGRARSNPCRTPAPARSCCSRCRSSG